MKAASGGTFAISSALGILCVAVAIAQTSIDKPQANRTVATSDQGAVLVGKEAQRLFKPCSRQAPKGVTGYWTPTPTDIHKLEQDWPRIVRLRPVETGTYNDHTMPQTSVPITRYYRQYAGFRRGHRQSIYVNAFSPGVVREQAEVSAKHRHDWHKQALIICDGGPIAFGIEYNVQTRKWTQLAFNGGL